MINKFIVSRDESIYEAWPDVILTDKGKLICIFSECEHHCDRTNARLTIRESTDRGRTWSDKKFLSEKAKDTGKLQQYMWYSDDNFQTWSDRITIAAHPDLNLCEVSILECDDGKLVAFMRENSGKGYPIFKSISHDNGESWEGIYETSMDSGHRPTSGFLQDGSVMVTYRYSHGGAQNVFAAFMSSDALEKTDRTEQNIRIMPLDYDRNPSPDLGYTGWVQFDDGEIYVVNYIKDDSDKAQIRGYSFHPEDVIKI